MKRILNIISQYPGKTGSGIYLQALIKEGFKKGHKQALVAALPLGEKYQDKYINEFFPVIFNSKELPFPIVGMSDIMPYESTKYSEMTEEMMAKWINEFSRVIKDAISSFKPDLIISHHLWMSSAIVADLAKEVKLIGICHGTDIRQLLNYNKYNDIIINGCNKLDLIFSLNSMQRDQISSIYNINLNKIEVLGGGYNEEIFYTPSSKERKNKIRLIYAGKLSFAKGLVSLINVFKSLKDKYDIELYIAGSGTGEEDSYIRRIGKYKDIHFLGEVSQVCLGEFFRKSDIFILPSFYEGLSLVTLEALASGLLVVSSEIPGLKSYLGKEIINSGVIEFVSLPDMIDVDKPNPENINEFNANLKRKIEQQILRSNKGFKANDNIINEIESKSWEHIYNKMESYL